MGLAALTPVLSGAPVNDGLIRSEYATLGDVECFLGLFLFFGLCFDELSAATAALMFLVGAIFWSGLLGVLGGVEG